MFEARVRAVPNGYRCAVLVIGTPNDSYTWAEVVAKTVVAATRQAFKEAKSELEREQQKLRKKVKERQKRRKET
jgi:hypothetical protein